ncbi:porin [Rhizobium terrae]|uniref:porin n=1 Tax=Rhizobium terrae TaxID=2171756 RepID=UPI000E3D7CF7|nr:porin [Rhizobium terrae]
MNIKSLLLGSAAALAAVSGAQAADAIVAAEPEPMEYVRVCDAFGTGYFYIPGTETCLKVGGYVRVEIQAGQTGPIGSYGGSAGAGVFPVPAAAGEDDYWDFTGRVQLDITAKSDTELGTLTSVASLRWNYGNNNIWTDNTNDASINEAYIQLGGFKIGRYLNWWDKGLNGESDILASSNTTRLNSVAYTYTGDTFSAGVQLDELSRTTGQEVGIEALVSAKFGGVAFDLLGGYDFGAEEGAIRALVSAAVGPGTLQASVVWSSGAGDNWAAGAQYQNAYYDRGEWALAASYAIKATDKLTITPGATYFWNTQVVAVGNGDWTGDDAWRAGLTVDYKIVDGLNLKTHVHYNEVPGDEYIDGFVRLDRTF